MITVDEPERHGYLGPQDQDLMASPEAQVSVGSHVSNEDLLLINKINVAINQGKRLEEIFNLLAQETKRVFSGYGASVYLLDESKERLILQNISLPPAVIRGVEKLTGLDLVNRNLSFKLKGLIQEPFVTKKPQLIDDPETMKRMMVEFAESASLPTPIRRTIVGLIPHLHKLMGVKTILNIPLVVKDDLFGLMGFSYPDAIPEPFVQRMETIAGQVTAALARRHAEQVLAEKAAKLEALQRVGMAMLSTNDTGERLAIIVDQAVDLVDAASCTVLLEDLKTGELVIQAATDQTIGLRVPPGEGIVGRVFQAGVPEIVLDVTRDPDHYPEIGRKSGVPTRSLLVVPLLVEEQALGVLTAVNKQAGRFDQQDLNFLLTLAGYAAVAVHNIRLHEQTQEEISQRARVDDARRQSEERFAKAFHASPDLILITSMGDGHYVDVNNSFLKTIGYTRGEVIGRSPDEINIWVNLSDREEFERILEENGRVEGFESIFRKKSGEIVVVILSGELIALDGDPCAIIISKDITARVQVEAALLRNEERYRSLFKDVPISLWEEDFSLVKNFFEELQAQGVTDFRTYFEEHLEAVVRCAGLIKILDVNQSTLDLYQADSKAELLKGLPRVMKEDTYSIVREELISLAEGATRFHGEGLNYTLKGELKFISLRLSVAPGYETTLARVLISITDITDHVRADQVLNQYAHRLKNLHKIDQGILAAHSPVEIARVAAHHLQFMLPCRWISVASVDQRTEKITILTLESGGERRKESGRRVSQGAFRELLEELHQGLHGAHSDGPAASSKEMFLDVGEETVPYLSIPLEVRDIRLGYLDMGTVSKGHFNQDDIEIAQEVAAQLAVAIQNANLYDISQQRLRQLTLLVNASAILSSSLDMDAVLPLVGNQIIAATGADYFSISEWDQESESLIVVLDYAADSQSQRDLPGTAFSLKDFPATRYVLHNLTPIVIHADDPGADPAEKTYLEEEGFQSLLMVPLVISDQANGLLELFLKKKRQYSPDVLELFQTLANQIATAMENARLFGQVQRHATELEARVAERTAQLEKLFHRQEALAEIEPATNQPHELIKLLEKTAYFAHEFLPASSGASVILWDEEKDVFSTTVTTVAWQPKDFGVQSVRRYKGATRWIIEHRQPYIVSELREDPIGANPHLARSGIQAYAGVPLLAEDSALGALYVFDNQPRTYSKDDLEFMSALASRAATAITKVQLYEAAQRRAEEAETLRQAGTAVAATLNKREAIDLILEQLARVVPHDSASVQWLEEGFLEIIGGRGWPDRQRVIGMQFPVPGENPNTEVIQKREPVILQDAPGKYEIFQKDTHHRIHSWLGVPLIVHDKVTGILALDSKEKNYFTSRHAQLASAFANHVAIVLDNVNLFEEIQKLAKTDELTAINNRRHLFELGRKEFERARRYQRPLAAIMIDIDHFKKVNDSHGHAAGDKVLYQLAQICKNSLRTVDIIGRYGGEEFVIIMPESTLQSARLASERIRKKVTENTFHTEAGDVKITISLGIAEMGKEIPDLATLLDRADTALYSAKNTGRNRFVVFNSGED